jgi:serine/threonine protein kinase
VADLRTQLSDALVDRYRLERELGRGGMATVFLAHDLRHKRSVALKILHPELAQTLGPDRFRREIETAARLQHPHILTVLDSGEAVGQLWFTMPYVEGESLRDRLRRETQLPVDDALRIATDAARALEYAHQHGVVHRDIKPENLFITRDADQPSRCIPKVLDFGISKLAADHPLGEGTLTATGAILGTPHYMSLEQLQGSEADARSDVYAFGIVLYECLTGARPFESDNFSAIVVKVATETPVDPIALRADLPPALRDVVCRAMARRAEDRHPSLTALIDALLPFMPEEPYPPVVPPEPVRAADPAQRAAEPVARSQPTQTSARSRESPATSGTRVRGLLAALVVVMIASGAWWLRPVGSSGAEAPLPAASSAKTAPATPTPRVASAAGSAAPAAGSSAQPAVDETVEPAAGSDLPASPRSPGSARFKSGWVYLGDFEGGRWITRYFDGWSEGLPANGTRLRARGRSYVRNAVPDALGALAVVNTTIGPEQPVELLERAHWQGGSFVWARVRPAR